jgi:hypothetical protein
MFSNIILSEYGITPGLFKDSQAVIFCRSTGLHELCF